MRLRIVAVGRLKAGPERELVDRYLDRAAKSGKALGFTRLDSREYVESRAARSDDRRAEEATAIVADLEPGTALVALDETGRGLSSEDFARWIAARRDAGCGDLVMAIGGPDGHGPAVRTRADLTLAFGVMTWPHQMVRLMLAEQVYRAMTILSGHPYHRA
ncbi:23S rRNA (pseudouridine(1915)-N(3))-methyltransferase RlmH [Prosthecodimorpha staleyi]|uniref:Ribosomal RNA large subunit methyltransferase H n=1 Tax=Prosthecodimorpha staleyi TaxID=2840188 RepID=A0A947DBJ8_9HYPH|nr:23S rRNA (pseudouridine(1915)-N(3))-methyltransferase RlmH [Prosthecodimorpha staleyi]MBT9292732.1 23S rRNA (pseudouridine(1915)-N(3))-methyltransferase RlmH [Prosthecodimorpha staleyi]